MRHTKPLPLDEAERQTLTQMSLRHPHRNVRARAAGLILISSGLSAAEAAERLGVSVPSAHNWRHLWDAQGLCGLMHGHNGGRHPALSREEVLLAAKIAEEESLTLCGIADRMQSRTGHELGCALKTLGEALKKEGFSFKKTRLSLKKNGTKPSSEPSKKSWAASKKAPETALAG